jgi:hypothetical protein
MRSRFKLGIISGMLLTLLTPTSLKAQAKEDLGTNRQQPQINPHSLMKLSNQKKLQKQLQAVAKILYQESEVRELDSLAGIEKTIRAQTLEYVTPELGVFFLKKQQEQQQEE